VSRPLDHNFGACPCSRCGAKRRAHSLRARVGLCGILLILLVVNIAQFY
jgi:uncharacterized protein (UPF0212 family)